jgi:hypothetical protein
VVGHDVDKGAGVGREHVLKGGRAIVVAAAPAPAAAQLACKALAAEAAGAARRVACQLCGAGVELPLLLLGWRAAAAVVAPPSRHCAARRAALALRPAPPRGRRDAPLRRFGELAGPPAPVQRRGEHAAGSGSAGSGARSGKEGRFGARDEQLQLPSGRGARKAACCARPRTTARRQRCAREARWARRAAPGAPLPIARARGFTQEWAYGDRGMLR